MSGTARRESGEVGRSLPFDGLALGGGGATVALWTDILTGVTGLPARRRRSGEAASAGAALLVACNGADVGFDAHAALDRLDPVVADIPADPGLVAQYSARRAVADAAAGAVIEIGFP